MTQQDSSQQEETDFFANYGWILVIAVACIIPLSAFVAYTIVTKKRTSQGKVDIEPGRDSNVGKERRPTRREERVNRNTAHWTTGREDVQSEFTISGYGATLGQQQERTKPRVDDPKPASLPSDRMDGNSHVSATSVNTNDIITQSMPYSPLPGTDGNSQDMQSAMFRTEASNKR